MKVSDLLVACLEKEGVSYVFGVPGEENEDLLFSLKKSSIKFIPTRHEQGAAFMANVFGRMTGRAGVCLATLGPGATNLVTGLGDAYMDKSPVVAITGQGGSTRLHKESHQAIDVVGMLKPITKWNISIQNPATTTESVRKAFKLAQEEKPGVTHIELPEDIAKLDIDDTPLSPIIVRRGAPDHKAVLHALELLAHAKRPLILAGNGAIRKRASKHLRAFVEATNIPVIATFMGKGALSDRDHRSLFTIGLKGNDFPVCALDASDLIITVGYDIAEYDPNAWNKNLNRPIIHIDFTPSEVDRAYSPRVEIVADISATLWEMNNHFKKNPKQYDNWFVQVRTLLEKEQTRYTHSSGTTPTVPFVLNKLRSVMSDNDILISDVGAHKMWIGRNFPVYEPGTCIISNGFASMGISLPGGLAAKLALPDRHVVTISGDGGFLMNSQEIETAKRLGVPYTIVVLNDNDYGLIKWKQTNHTGESFGTELTNPNFKMYGESFGITTYHISRSEEVEETLRKAIESRELTLVAIDIDPSENRALTKRLEESTCPSL